MSAYVSIGSDRSLVSRVSPTCPSVPQSGAPQVSACALLAADMLYYLPLLAADMFTDMFYYLPLLPADMLHSVSLPAADMLYYLPSLAADMLHSFFLFLLTCGAARNQGSSGVRICTSVLAQQVN